MKFHLNLHKLKYYIFYLLIQIQYNLIASNEELDKQLAKSSRVREYPDGKLETMSESEHHGKTLMKSKTGLNKTSDKKVDFL